jgi:hypothetical protein
MEETSDTAHLRLVAGTEDTNVFVGQHQDLTIHPGSLSRFICDGLGFPGLCISRLQLTYRKTDGTWETTPACKEDSADGKTLARIWFPAPPGGWSSANRWCTVEHTGV